MRLSVFAALLLLSAAAGPARAQCTKDTDCKGERICEEGKCVYPRATVPPEIVPAPDVPPADPPADEPPREPPPAPSKLTLTVDAKKNACTVTRDETGGIGPAYISLPPGTYDVSVQLNINLGAGRSDGYVRDVILSDLRGRHWTVREGGPAAIKIAGKKPEQLIAFVIAGAFNPDNSGQAVLTFKSRTGGSVYTLKVDGFSNASEIDNRNTEGTLPAQLKLAPGTYSVSVRSDLRLGGNTVKEVVLSHQRIHSWVVREGGPVTVDIVSFLFDPVLAYVLDKPGNPKRSGKAELTFKLIAGPPADAPPGGDVAPPDIEIPLPGRTPPRVTPRPPDRDPKPETPPEYPGIKPVKDMWN